MDYLVHHLVRASAARYPHSEALVHGPERLSYLQLWQQVQAVAAGLRQAGVARTDRIGVYLEPSLALPISLFGISQAGGVFVPMHHGLLADQIQHIVRDCGVTGLITDATRFAALADSLTELPSLKFVATTGALRQVHVLAHHDLDQWRATPPAAPLMDMAIEKDLAAILYTSGSTGLPKGVMLSHANLLAGSSIVSDYLSITHRDRILAVLPFSFDAGLNQLLTAVQQGGTCVLLKFLFAREIVNTLAKERITGLAGVPTLWSLLAQQNSRLHETDLPDLRYITNTGGAMPQHLLATLRDALPTTDVILMYGLTEAFRSTYLPPEELDRRPTSIGKAIPNTEILVINDQGKLCAPGEVGELVHHGPTVSLGYWGHPELTRRVLRPHPFPAPGVPEPDKVCYSGDLVQADEQGFLYFVGRRDHLIKSSGFRVSPTEVETALCKTGLIHEAAVIGVPDELLGQQIRAFVVARQDKTIDVNDLLAKVTTTLPRYMIPKCVEVLGELPKTASGKVDYPALRQRVDSSESGDHSLRNATYSASNRVLSAPY